MAWTVSAQNDTDALAATGGRLYRNELVTLCTPRSWVSDVLIDYGVTVIAAEESPQGYGQVFNGVFWLEPSIVNTSKDGNDETFRNMLGDVGALGAPALLDSAPVTVLP